MIGCLLGIFVLPYRFLKWGFTSGIKGYIVLGATVIILLVGFFMIRSSINDQITPPQQQQTYELNLPDRYAAPFKVDTTTRSYYAKLAVKDKKTGDVTMTDWWELIGRKWTKNQGVMVLDTASYGKNITVTKRR